MRLNNPFHYQSHPLAMLAMKCVQAYIQSMQTWQEEVAKGKMFGVLVVEDQQQQLGFLAAYSGQIEGKSDWLGFVPAVCDSALIRTLFLGTVSVHMNPLMIQCRVSK